MYVSVIRHYGVYRDTDNVFKKGFITRTCMCACKQQLVVITQHYIAPYTDNI